MAGGDLYVIVCAAGPAAEAGRLVGMAQRRGWEVQVVATPSAVGFLDVAALERQTGRPVRTHYRRPDEPKPPRAGAIIVAPATFNTVNKFALGIADTYALGLLAEAPGLRIPVVLVPYVNAALAARPPFRRALEALREEGVRVLFEPHPAGAGEDEAAAFPWDLAFTTLTELTTPPEEA
ncbi:flavoprotein [Spongiactinospora gelatinilytica]|uniref:Flavoprotein n=1 Tax=Spongiactinospora gelatinilytica TaxID=2666298 RepID=A0A2W2H3E3_9ACTN|nr:flavoprotein [Spongiactinospora gelatinilytica]PZG44480.1 flavoprotein [Spongiactinospora gelatinilytica]